MKKRITIVLLATLAGCTQPSVPVTAPAQTQDQVLKQLKADLPKASVTVKKQKVDIVVEWMTHASARMCSRTLDISLVDNKLGAFLYPVQNLSPLTGASLQDVDLAFSTQVKSYLKEKGISETRIQAGENIEFNYMEEDAEQSN